jgi:hypothetical protein
MTDSVISFRQRPYLSSVTTNVVPQEEAAAYTAQGVNFDGASGGLQRNADLGGANAKVGIVSFWLKMQGGDAGFQAIIEPDGSTTGLSVYRWNDNKIRIVGHNAADAVILDLKSTTSLVAGGAWKHVLASWNLATSQSQLYLNDVDDSNAVTTTDDTIDYTKTDWFIGGRSGASLLLNADIADLYFNIVTSFDLSNSTNRRKFISAGGAPVDLGSDGSTPTGTAPIVFLHGPVAGWETNDGSGGGFIELGTLTAASTNPP